MNTTVSDKQCRKERQRLWSANIKLAAEAEALRQRVEQLETALEEIATSKYQAYPEPFEINTAATSQYKIGIADGHRYCANVARKALGKPLGIA